MSKSKEELDTGYQEAPPRVTTFQYFRRVFFGRGVVIFGFFVVALFIIVGVFAPLLAPYDPYAQDLDNVMNRLKQKAKRSEIPNVNLETLGEGLCVQMLHVGPYERTFDTVQRMKEFAEMKGLRLHGRHHEIYLSDPTRLSDRPRIIFRHPIH